MLMPDAACADSTGIICSQPRLSLRPKLDAAPPFQPLTSLHYPSRDQTEGVLIGTCQRIIRIRRIRSDEKRIGSCQNRNDRTCPSNIKLPILGDAHNDFRFFPI